MKKGRPEINVNGPIPSRISRIRCNLQGTALMQGHCKVTQHFSEALNAVLGGWTFVCVGLREKGVWVLSFVYLCLWRGFGCLGSRSLVSVVRFCGGCALILCFVFCFVSCGVQVVSEEEGGILGRLWFKALWLDSHSVCLLWYLWKDSGSGYDKDLSLSFSVFAVGFVSPLSFFGVCGKIFVLSSVYTLRFRLSVVRFSLSFCVSELGVCLWCASGVSVISLTLSLPVYAVVIRGMVSFV